MNMIKYDETYEILPCGFNNLGNTCYFNALIQALLSCTSFNKIIYENKDNKKYKQNKVISKYLEILENMKNGKKM